MRARACVLGLLVALTAATPASAAYGRNGPYLDYATVVPLGKHGKPPTATPVTVAQYGLQAAATFSVTGRRAYREDALQAADWLVRNQSRGGGWGYRSAFTVRGFPPLQRGWVSAMAQGQAMSLLWRAYRLKPRRSYRRAALLALRPFRRSVARGGVVSDFDGVPWFEEFPTVPGSHVLNGYGFSLLGLYDVAPWSRRAGNLFRTGAASLGRRIGRFDRPGGSYYLPGWAATDYYNGVHVDLVTAIDSIQPMRVLRRYRDRWWKYTAD